MLRYENCCEQLTTALKANETGLVSNSSELNEFELLLMCASPASLNFGEAPPRLRSGFDWELFLSLCCEHSMQPLAHWRLLGFLSSIPEAASVAARLEEFAMVAVMFGNQLNEAIIQLSSVFDQQGVDALFLKGPFLSEFLYGDDGLRISSDIDVYVDPESLSKTLHALSQSGWLPVTGRVSERVANYEFLSSAKAVMLMDQFPFSSPTLNVTLDLHWRFERQAVFAHFETPQPEWLEYRTFKGLPLKVLRPEPLLAFLCLHGAKHHWQRLSWLVDIVFWLDRYGAGANWSEVKQLLRGSERSFALMALLLKELFGRDELIQQVGELEPVVDRMAQQVITSLRNVQANVWIGATEVLFGWRLEKSWAGKAKVFAYHMRPTERDWAAVPLPEALWFLYSAVHLLVFTALRLPRTLLRMSSGVFRSGLIVRRDISP